MKEKYDKDDIMKDTSLLLHILNTVFKLHMMAFIFDQYSTFCSTV